MNKWKYLTGIALAAATAGAAAERAPSSPSAYRDYALKRDGDAARGRELFFAPDRLGCANCHSVDGSATKAGPDLFAAGDRFPRRELIAAILEPSAVIAVGYGATLIETRAGEKHYGIVKQANGTATELMAADGSTIRVATAEIKSQEVSPLSLMPEGLQSSLSLQEFTDLIEYLATLKQPATSLMANRGRPEVIPELARPVTLRPFFREDLRLPATVRKKPGDVRLGLVWFGQIPGRENDFLAVHQSGKIWRIGKYPDGDTKELFLDLSAEVYCQRGPNGLLGLTFHPKFRENRKYYLKHQMMVAGRMETVLVERRVTADFMRDSGTPSRRLLGIPCVTENHTGGCIAFGPDGFLYLGMGDTGPQQDPEGHGQDLALHLGKILRIDVDRTEGEVPYGIPATNPFRGRADARPEIWAMGFREPWRFSFDRVTGDLWVGDVGQDRVEEVAIVRQGENHGWNVFEGFEPFSNLRRQPGASYVAPVFAYRRKFGNSVTGGFVYRGDPKSSFYGVYVCGDFTSHLIWGLKQEGRALQSVAQLGVSPEGIASFGTDERGQLYVVGYEGMVYRIDFDKAVFDAPPVPTGGVNVPAAVMTK